MGGSNSPPSRMVPAPRGQANWLQSRLSQQLIQDPWSADPTTNWVGLACLSTNRIDSRLVAICGKLLSENHRPTFKYFFNLSILSKFFSFSGILSIFVQQANRRRSIVRTQVHINRLPWFPWIRKRTLRPILNQRQTCSVQRKKVNSTTFLAPYQLRPLKHLNASVNCWKGGLLFR